MSHATNAHAILVVTGLALLKSIQFPFSYFESTLSAVGVSVALPFNSPTTGTINTLANQRVNKTFFADLRGGSTMAIRPGRLLSLHKVTAQSRFIFTSI